jgi:hypothetical protein
MGNARRGAAGVFLRGSIPPPPPPPLAVLVANRRRQATAQISLPFARPPPRRASPRLASPRLAISELGFFSPFGFGWISIVSLLEGREEVGGGEKALGGRLRAPPREKVKRNPPPPTQPRIRHCSSFSPRPSPDGQSLTKAKGAGFPDSGGFPPPTPD